MISTATETLDYMKASQAAPEATPLTTHMAGVIAAGTPGANITPGLTSLSPLL